MEDALSSADAIISSRQKLELEIKKGAGGSIVNLVNCLIELAYDVKSSDIHIDPQADFVRVRFRIDGVLHDETPLVKGIQSEIISRIKILAGIRTDEHPAAEDGRFN